MAPLVARLLNILLPTACQVCDTPLVEDPPPICRPCWAGVQPFDGPACPRCGRPFDSPVALAASPGHLCGECRDRPPVFNQAVAAAPYEGVVAEAIKLMKYRGRSGLASLLGELLIARLPALPESEAILPVPLHPHRLRERGFNQALLLAHAVSRRTGLPLMMDGLARVRATPPQVELAGKARRRNVRGAFAVRRPEHVVGLALLLIDDVFTTGATVAECARALRKAGARAVYVLTVARLR